MTQDKPTYMFLLHAPYLDDNITARGAGSRMVMVGLTSPVVVLFPYQKCRGGVLAEQNER